MKDYTINELSILLENFDTFDKFLEIKKEFLIDSFNTNSKVKVNILNVIETDYKHKAVNKIIDEVVNFSMHNSFHFSEDYETEEFTFNHDSVEFEDDNYSAMRILRGFINTRVYGNQIQYSDIKEYLQNASEWKSEAGEIDSNIIDLRKLLNSQIYQYIVNKNLNDKLTNKFTDDSNKSFLSNLLPKKNKI